MATSEVSMGKIIDHASRGMPIPTGWAVDSKGKPTTDPNAALAGAISPFGGPKGYGLGLAIEALVASMSSTAYGRDVRGTLDSVHPSSKGDFFVVIRQPDPHRALAAVSHYLDEVRMSPAADADRPIRVPGDRAASRRKDTSAVRITVPDVLWSELEMLREGLSPSASSVPTIREQ
jgi:LDH2 family malate/lactate/ureidoglycolate dehydrogenase